jgi:hypothetical protein
VFLTLLRQLYQSFHPRTSACTAGLTGQHFEIILQTIAPHLTSNNVSGKEQIPQDKQLLLLIWYISKQESMREAENLFGISISTVHGTVLKVCHVFNQTFKNVG